MTRIHLAILWFQDPFSYNETSICKSEMTSIKFRRSIITIGRSIITYEQKLNDILVNIQSLHMSTLEIYSVIMLFLVHIQSQVENYFYLE